jgi:hypothetical protein
MASATHRSPALRVVNSGGVQIEGPYELSVVPNNAPANYGLTLGTVEAREETVTIGPWLNFQWAQMSYLVGYRYHVSLRFSMIESDPASLVYGLTLLHRLWRIAVEYQTSYAALQFRMFSTGAWRGVVPDGTEWAPQLIAGKQGFYTASVDLVTREIVPIPGEWAQGLW